MSKTPLAIVIGMFVLGIFVSHAITTTLGANAAVRAGVSQIQQVVPFDLMVKSKGLPVEASNAF